jgi:hypothetical protein
MTQAASAALTFDPTEGREKAAACRKALSCRSRQDMVLEYDKTMEA